MKNVILVILSLFIVCTGIVFAVQNNKQNVIPTNKGDIKMTDKKVLVAYFSATGTTKKVAENLANATGGDLYEIKPLKPYTNADLDWTNEKSRSSVEMKDYKSRPEMVNDNFSVSDYDTIYLGFPIWWYIAPTIVNTFLEKHDFSNKTIVLFATSGGSSSSTKIIEGDILNGNPSVDELKKWVKNF